MTQEEIIRHFERYSSNIDELLREELTNLYYSSTEKERILITKVTNDSKKDVYMPDVWAEFTIRDGSKNEKITLAKYATSPTTRFCRFEVTQGYKKIGKSLSEILLESDDQLIKCALYENSDFLPYSGVDGTHIQIFKKCSFIERLALVRNDSIDLEVIQKIYDVRDQDFGLTNNDRHILIQAFMHNKRHKSASHCFVSYPESPGKVNDKYNKLWDLALGWQEPSLDELSPSVSCMTFHNFGCSMEKMVEVYKKLERNTSDSEESAKRKKWARTSIIQGIESLKLDKENYRTYAPVLKEALGDEDGKEMDEMYEYSIRGIASSLLDGESAPKKKEGLAKNVWRYGWTVIKNLATLIVIACILSIGENKFEKVILDILVLIYLTLASYVVYSGYIQAHLWHENYERFKRIRSLLKESLDKDAIENEQMEYEAIKNELKINTIKFWINSVFHTLYWIIVIFTLLNIIS